MPFISVNRNYFTFLNVKNNSSGLILIWAEFTGSIFFQLLKWYSNYPDQNNNSRNRSNQ